MVYRACTCIGVGLDHTQTIVAECGRTSKIPDSAKHSIFRQIGSCGVVWSMGGCTPLGRQAAFPTSHDHSDHLGCGFRLWRILGVDPRIQGRRKIRNVRRSDSRLCRCWCGSARWSQVNLSNDHAIRTFTASIGRKDYFYDP